MKSKRTPTNFEAFLPIIVMALMVLVGNIIMGIRLEFLLIIASIFSAIIAIRVGISWDEMMKAYTKKFSDAFPAILILIAIGGVVGTWMFSGTVPMMIYYGLKFLNPKFVVVTAFVVTALVSTFTGTSWGSAATSGVAFLGIAQSMGIPLPVVAGAIISGAFFGDKVSPVSDTTNLSAMSSEISVYEHIKGMLPNVIISGALSLIAFTIVGSYYFNGNSELTDTTLKIMSDLNSIYNFNIAMLIPPVIVFGGGYFGISPLLLMLGSSITAMFIGVFSNGFLFNDAANALISGFNISMAESIGINVADITPRLLGLLNRGGFASMMGGAVLFCFLAMPFGSFMEVSGALDKVVQQMSKAITGVFSLTTVTFFTGCIMNGITGNGQFSIMTTGQLFKESFKKQGVPLSVLSRTMENSMTLLESLLPWHVTAIYMSTTLGVFTTEYVKWSFFNIFGIFVFFLQTYLLSRKLNKSNTSSINEYETTANETI